MSNDQDKQTDPHVETPNNTTITIENGNQSTPSKHTNMTTVFAKVSRWFSYYFD